MRVGRGGPVAWWSPDPRGIVPLDAFHESRSLRRSRRRFVITVDTAFDAVMQACAEPARPHGWIDDDFVDRMALHRLVWAHSVEGSMDAGGETLAGGVWRVAIGAPFAGSMFHRVTDAGESCAGALVDLLRDGGASLARRGWDDAAFVVARRRRRPRAEYLELLSDAVARPGRAGSRGRRRQRTSRRSSATTGRARRASQRRWLRVGPWGDGYADKTGTSPSSPT